MGEQPLHQCLPFFVERSAHHRPPGLAIPVGGILVIAFPSVQVAMHLATVRVGAFVHQTVRCVPLVPRVVPEGLERVGEASRGRGARNAVAEGVEGHSHQTVIAPLSGCVIQSQGCDRLCGQTKLRASVDLPVRLGSTEGVPHDSVLARSLGLIHCGVGQFKGGGAVGRGGS